MSPIAPELLVAEIGSTVTKLSAFAGIEAADEGTGRARFLGQGVALTTVTEGDVTLGLAHARTDLEARIGTDTRNVPLAAASSAAGGLRMSVHGLTPRMTLRAAREASLGAGAVIVHTTAGAMTEEEADAAVADAPRLVLLAGGVDDGDRATVVHNARRLAPRLARARPAVPVVYAGNRAARAEVCAIFGAAGVPVFPVSNVYPRVDVLDVGPARTCIQRVFAAHIITAPGMDRVRERCTGALLPTPGAVLRATELLAEALGDVMTVDVGGATTDVHSVTGGPPEHERLRVAPEPHAKRTVEGDLGVYLNAARVASVPEGQAFGPPAPGALGALAPVPDSPQARRLAIELTRIACNVAVRRHAGERHTAYGVAGVSEVIEGRDLGAVRWIVGTGGALTRLGAGEAILAHLAPDPTGRKLLPPSPPLSRVVIDRDYVMASAGVMSERHPGAALELMLASLGLEHEERAASGAGRDRR